MSANNRKTGNLLALGSAAVVAVYGAGFMRTAAAAERFAQQSNEHVLSPAEAEVIAALANESPNGPVAPAGVAPAHVQSDATKDTAPVSASRNKVDATTAKSSASRAVAESSIATATTVATVPPANNVSDARANADVKSASTAAAPTAAAMQSSTVAASAPATVAAPPVAPPTSATTSSAAAASNTNASASVTPAPTPPAAVPAPAPVSPAPTKTEDAGTSALKWKDGNYTGYGTSRHGDIEVYLETDGGKISFIKISACLTQYSCSWISELPGQVIARQSPKVDAPSGATQSANAFYYAVVQALSKAK